MQAAEAGEKFHPASFIGGGVHFGSQQLGYGYGEVVVDVHPLQEGFRAHGDDFTGGCRFVGGGVEVLPGENF